MTMTFSLFCWIVLAMVVSIIIATLVLDVLRLLALGVCMGWLHLSNWYYYGNLPRDGRKATYVPAKIVMSQKNILKKGVLVLLIIVLVIVYITIGLPLIQ